MELRAALRFLHPEYKVTNVSSDTLEDVFMAFRYDVDVSSSETGTANYSADDFIALDETPDALNPDAHPNRFLSYGFSNASAPGYIGLRVLDAYVGEIPQDATATIPFVAHKRLRFLPIHRPLPRCTP